MSKPPLFLDTTIQIERIVGSVKRQSQLQEMLVNYRLITSTYVLGEFLRTLVKDSIQLYNLIGHYTHLDEVISYLGQHPNKREAGRMMLILGILLRINRIAASKLDSQMRVELQERLTRHIEIGLLDQFLYGIDDVLDATQCGLAHERSQSIISPVSNVLVYRLRSQCVRHVRECDLAERMQTWQPELKALASGLAHESDPSLLRIGELARQIVENPMLARGRNCTWYLGDLVIALELPEDIPLYTTNLRHFTPILTILGKKLYQSDSLQSDHITSNC